MVIAKSLLDFLSMRNCWDEFFKELKNVPESSMILEIPSHLYKADLGDYWFEINIEYIRTRDSSVRPFLITIQPY